MSSWFWHKKSDSRRRGPVDDATLKEMARIGELDRHDKVWQDGMSDWVYAYSIPSLFSTPPPISTEGHDETQPQGSTVATPEMDVVLERGNSKEQRIGITENHLSSELISQRDRSQVNLEADSQPEGQYYSLQEVGGWLKFFCFALLILAPIFTLGHLVNQWDMAQPLFEVFPELRNAMLTETMIIVFLLIYGMITGALIWNGHPRGHELAKRYLLIRFFGFVIAAIIVMAILSSLPNEMFDAAAEGAIRSIGFELILFAIWFLYFKKSKRVAATYGSSLDIA